MEDLISREALITDIDNIIASVDGGWMADELVRKGLRKALSCIYEAPAVDAEFVNYATWERYPGPEYIRCSHCKMEFDEDKMPSVRGRCPNCGAVMKE